MTTTTAEQTRLEHVALATIKAHPDNPRVDVGDVTDLAASIESVGLMEPLVVAPPHDGMTARQMGKATHVLIAGHRRLAAAKKAKLATVPVLVRSDLTTRAAQVEAMLVENLQRTDLTPVEEADAYQLILDIEGLTQKALAAKVGQPATRIRDRLKLAKIGDAARAALQAHQVTIDQALAIAEFDDDPKRQKAILKEVGGDRFTFTVNAARREREAEQERARVAEALAAAGVKVEEEQPKGSKSLYEIPLPGHPNGAYVRDLETETKLHGDCPGRAAWLQYGSITYGCTQPKLHPRPKVKKTKAELDREAKEKAELDDLGTKLGAAADTRADFLRRQILARPTTKTTSTVGEVLRERGRELVVEILQLREKWFGGSTFDDASTYVEILTGTRPDPKDKGVVDSAHADHLARLVDQALADVDVDGLLVAIDLAKHINDEAHLRKASLWARYEHVWPWLRALTAYGYPWSDYERDRFVFRVNEGDGRIRHWTVDGAGDLVDDSEGDA